MKTKKEKRTLEFTKETIARLGEGELHNFIGGTGVTGNSLDDTSPCTVTLRTKHNWYTCNPVICGTIK
jgi:hypothetical protein